MRKKLFLCALAFIVPVVCAAGEERPAPLVGFEVSTSPNGMGDRSITNGAPVNYGATPVSLQADIALFRGFGVLSAGPTFDYYFISSSAGGAAYVPSYFWMGGGELRYQAHFAERQFLVPTVAYSVGETSYKNDNGGSGYFLTQGPSAGLWLFLNSIDHGTAGEAFHDLGISRSYLILEYRQLSGHDDATSLTSSAIHLGLRVEI